MREEFPSIVIVLQIGKHAFDEVGRDIHRLVQKLSIEYKELIDYVLFDMSGGVGIGLDRELCENFVQQLTMVHLETYFGIGVAGGLDGTEVPGLNKLFSIYPELCVDAQGKLRDGLDRLDVISAATYAYFYTTFFHSDSLA